jgi:hypothetical protein
MFDATSRYFGLDNATLTAADGRVIVYKRRRFLPPANQMQTVAEVLVAPGDRLDLIAARLLGDPEQFWRIADANNALDPAALVARPGRTLRVALPSMQG